MMGANKFNKLMDTVGMGASRDGMNHMDALTPLNSFSNNIS